MITIERLNLKGEGIAHGITAARTLLGEEIDGEIVDFYFPET